MTRLAPRLVLHVLQQRTPRTYVCLLRVLWYATCHKGGKLEAQCLQHPPPGLPPHLSDC